MARRHDRSARTLFLRCTFAGSSWAACFGWHVPRLLDSSFEDVLCLADEPIHFMLLVPSLVYRITGAAALAVERVNANKALRRLEYSWADSGCSAEQGLAAMGELLRGASRVDAVIGPGCSSACEVTSYLSGGQGIPQISYSCTAASLSNKEKYRLVSPFAVLSHMCYDL